jgi:3-demethoxyubiquinol 3-hydroxylase
MLNLDRLIVEFDKGLRTLLSEAHSARPYPDADVADVPLDNAEKNKAASLMRVNHSGEICAQALYQGQALTARDPVVQQKLKRAAEEETEHLAWTAHRVHELGGHLSALNPFWYSGSLVMGAMVGLLGDKWNLGFLAETEQQVGEHLQSHLERLPLRDEKSRAIVSQMYTDEVGHAEMAMDLGGAVLPKPAKMLMKLNGRVMTSVAYRI